MAGVLEGIGLDERLLIRDHYIERAFGGTNAVAIARRTLRWSTWLLVHLQPGRAPWFIHVGLSGWGPHV